MTKSLRMTKKEELVKILQELLEELVEKTENEVKKTETKNDKTYDELIKAVWISDAKKVYEYEEYFKQLTDSSQIEILNVAYYKTRMNNIGINDVRSTPEFKIFQYLLHLSRCTSRFSDRIDDIRMLRALYKNAIED
jgi:flavodoxin